MTDEKLSRNFFLSELLASSVAVRLGIPNTPTASDLGNIRNFLAPGLQSVRDLLDVPMVVSSGYRGQALNAAVGGSKTSQHMVGLAADFTAPGFGTPLQVCRAIVAAGLAFDQIIMEGAWVHISFSAKPRRQVLTARFGPGGATYSHGLS